MIDNGNDKKYAVALGFFDGLHTAHMSVLNETVKYAEKGLIPAVILFDTHPRNVISGDSVPMLLTPEKRDERLFGMGIRPFILSFSEIKELSPEEFIDRILVSRLNAGAVVCGFNYRFGKNGAGDSSTLLSLCEKKGIGVTVCPEFFLDGEEVSSTKIRKAVKEGDIERANTLLGYAFTFSSEVFRGDMRGRLLGTPTVNQLLPEGITVPKFGVYASRVSFDGESYYGVSNIGIRPTFGGGSVRSETYIIDYSGDLYGKRIDIELYKLIRDEKHFPDAESLKAQISEDVKAAKAYFSVAK